MITAFICIAFILGGILVGWLLNDVVRYIRSKRPYYYKWGHDTHGWEPRK